MLLRNATVLVVSACLSAVAQTPAQPPRAPRVSVGTPSGSYLGVMMQEVDSERAKALKLREEAGVEITRVEPDSPAEKAGLKVADVVLQYNDQHVEGMEQFSRIVRETPAGREVRLEIVRNAISQTIIVKLAARPAARVLSVTGGVPMAPFEHLELQIPDMPRSLISWRSSVLGIEAESLDGQLAQFFGVKDGVLVRSVAKGSSAEKGGVRAGDVVLKVDDSKVATPAEISARIRAHGKTTPLTISLQVMREHHEMTLSISVDDLDHSEWLFEHRSNVKQN